MFPNNLLSVEKLVQTKQSDILREAQGRNRYDLPEAYDVRIEPQRKHGIWTLVGMLVLLGWLFGLVF